jgi:hypothetical protein
MLASIKCSANGDISLNNTPAYQLEVVDFEDYTER